MRRIALIALLGCAALLSGCGQLNVRVDVLDPEHVRGEMADERLRKLYREVMAAQPGEFAASMDAQAGAYTQAMLKLAAQIDELGKKLGGTPGAALQSTAAGQIEVLKSGTPAALASSQGTLAENLAQDLRDSSEATRWGGRVAAPATVREQLLALEAAVKAPRVQQGNELRELKRSVGRFTALVNPPVPAAVAPAAAASAAAIAPQAKATADLTAAVAAVVNQRSIIGDGSLAATEFAYVVARAPDNLWATNFNRAFASGTFGNSDIVIRLNSTADFSVKGMLFDASKVAQVASKVMTQAVLIGTQMAGVPVSAASTGTPTGGEALSKSSADLATAEAALAKRQALVASQRDAMRSLARVILGSATQLESDAIKGKGKDDPTRAPMHKAIDDSFTALKPLLSMQDLQ
ncbi:MAG: hypothetical protein ACK4PH_01755 [Aquincola tertiaricarbonis]